MFIDGHQDIAYNIQNFQRNDDLKILFLPGSKDLIGWSGEKDSGNKYIRIEDYFHFLLRTLVRAAIMSDRFMPAFLACLRAFAIKSSNSLRDGGDIDFKMTTSLLPVTTN